MCCRNMRDRCCSVGLIALLVSVSLLMVPARTTAAPVDQVVPGGRYVPRPVPIRRLPGGRALRIVSWTYGGETGAYGTCPAAPETAQSAGGGEVPTHDGPSVSFREPTIGNDPSAGVLFLPGSGEPIHASSVPVLCVGVHERGVEATAVPPGGGQDLPALVVPDGPVSAVTLPLEAYTLPGVWRIDVTAPVETSYEFTVAPFERPTLVVGGDSLLPVGFQPGETISGLILVNRCTTEFVPLSDPKEALPPLDEADSTECSLGADVWEAVQLFDVTADEHGMAMLQRIDPDHDFTYVIFGTALTNPLSNIASGSELADAIRYGDFAVDAQMLFEDNDTGDSNRTGGNGAEVNAVVPAPGTLPATGASINGSLSDFGVVFTIVVLAALAMAVAGALRQETS